MNRIFPLSITTCATLGLSMVLLISSCSTAPSDNATKTKEEAVEAPKQTKEKEDAPELAPEPQETVLADENQIEDWAIAQIPDDYELLEFTIGELNNDPATEERVLVVDTGEESDMGTKRKILIYSGSGNEFTKWYEAAGGILASEHGGMMGDPLDRLSIERGCIVIEHFGGSRYKWRYTHRFRFQNNHFELIGATTYSGAPCEEWTNFDYNLSTGKCIFTHTDIACDDAGEETSTEESPAIEWVSKLDDMPTLKDFYPGSNSIEVPGGEHEGIYY